jgi:hypothetical protein
VIELKKEKAVFVALGVVVGMAEAVARAVAGLYLHH